MATPLECAQSCLTRAAYLLLAPTPDRLDECAALFGNAAEHLRQMEPEHRTPPEINAFVTVWRETNSMFISAEAVVGNRLRSSPCAANYGANGRPVIRFTTAAHELARY